MAELQTLARPYANAVFQLAKGEGKLDQWSRMLGILAAAAGDERVRLLLDSPELPEIQKAYRLADVCGEDLDDRGKRFLNVLAENRRLDVIAAIQEQFEELKAAEESVLDVEVISAFAVSDAEAQALQQALTRRFDKSVNLSSSVDASLIGGAIIRAGDTVIDGSVRGKLNKLGETLQRA